MALLRLMVLALGAALLAACGQAGAQPSQASGIVPPAGWQALPELSTTVAAAAKAEGVTIDGTEAWGETAMGCYGVWLALHGDGATSEEVMKGLDASGVKLADVVKPDLGDDGIISLTLDRPPYHGRLRVRVAAPAIKALACFANEREPAACERACTALLGALP